MKQFFNSLNTLTRRAFAERCAATAFGLTILPNLPPVAAESEVPKPAAFGKAQNAPGPDRLKATQNDDFQS